METPPLPSHHFGVDHDRCRAKKDDDQWVPNRADGVPELKQQLRALAEGQVVSCRRRDPRPGRAWQHGSCRRDGAKMFFFYRCGRSFDDTFAKQCEIDEVRWFDEEQVFRDDLKPVDDTWYCPGASASQSAIAAFKTQFSQLPNGTILQCRGRDSVSERWDYGWCRKDHDALSFLYQGGDAEKWSSVVWGNLVQVLKPDLEYSPGPKLESAADDESFLITPDTPDTPTDSQRIYPPDWYYLHKWKSIASSRGSELVYNKQLDRGCVGMTTLILANKDVRLPYHACFTPGYGWADFRVARSVWSSLAFRGSCLFAMCFWSNPGQDHPDPEAFLPDEHCMVDMTPYDAKEKFGKGRKGKVNFDFGWYEQSSDSIWHANHSAPVAPGKDPMRCYQSTVTVFLEELTLPDSEKEFDRVVWFIAPARFGQERVKAAHEAQEGRPVTPDRGVTSSWGSPGAFNPRRRQAAVILPLPSVETPLREFCIPGSKFPLDKTEGSHLPAKSAPMKGGS